MFYSKSTGGFYDAAIHGDSIPSDAVEITVEQHRALLEGQSQGKVITYDESGKPFLTDPRQPTAEEILAQRKAVAKSYLDSTDWYFARLAETGIAVPEEVLSKRSEARTTMNEV